MSYRIFLKKSAEKELSKLEQHIHDRIIEKVQNLKDNPRPVGVKKLGDQEEYRLRISDYRVLYTIDDRKKIIEIVSVGHRKVAYR